MKFAQRALNLKTSPTLFLVARAKELQAQGHPVISLTVGEPDWPTMAEASEAGIEAIRKHNTKYTPASGNLELRKAIAAKYKLDLNLDYKPTEVMVGPGAKFVIFAALQMLCEAGDEVIIPSPYWVSYPTMAELTGATAKTVICDEKENFKITAQKLKEAITEKTKVFLFSSPSNPTGLVYTSQDLESLAEVFRQNPHVTILSDDIYNNLYFGNDGTVAPHLLKVAPDLKERTLVINGGSKSYAMTGWRIGWAAGPQKLIQLMGDYQSQATGAPSTIAQEAALVALQKGEPEIRRVVQLLKQRLDSALKLFATIPGLSVAQPQGAFYLWVNIKSYLGKKFKDQTIATDKDFAEILLTQFFVATVPGTESGNNGYLRISFATTDENMKEAVHRLKEMTAAIR